MTPWLARIRQRIATRRRPAPAVDWRTTIKRRSLVAVSCLALWAFGIEARLAYLQIVAREDLAAQATEQQSRSMPLPARRGDIFDRRHRLLATSAEADTVWADPPALKDPAATLTAICRVLKDCEPGKRADILARLVRGAQKKGHFAYIRQFITPEQAKAITALELPGVYLKKESRRYYPNGELAASVLGWSGRDEAPLGGIELAYNRYIGGTDGELSYQTDARKNFFNRVEHPAQPGGELELNIDARIQHVAERELAIGVREHRAEGGTVIVMVPRTGEILAMASVPTFNPNTFTAADLNNTRNMAVQYMYEPGSTFKIVTAAAAIEEHVMPIDTMIDTSPGMIRVGKGPPIYEYEHHNYGLLSFQNVIVKSSNIGAVKLGLKIGVERLSRYVDLFGFGRPVGGDFPTEASGKVWRSDTWTDRALASVSMGYQISVTPLQMAAAFSSVANRGVYIQPRILRSVQQNGKRIAVTPTVVRRTVSEETAATLIGVMEQVVENPMGTANRAKIPGYTVAGKTGTASKLIDKRYSPNINHASFAGFVPSRDPAITIVVMIDAPHAGGRAGGVVAAPIFQRIAEQTLKYLGVPPTINPPPPVLVAKRDIGESPVVPTLIRAQRDAVDTIATAEGTVPDLSGLSLREATRRLSRLGLWPDTVGNGVVTAQMPPPGTPIAAGMVCRLLLDRTSERRTSPP